MDGAWENKIHYWSSFPSYSQQTGSVIMYVYWVHVRIVNCVGFLVKFQSIFWRLPLWILPCFPFSKHLRSDLRIILKLQHFVGRILWWARYLDYGIEYLDIWKLLRNLFKQLPLSIVRTQTRNPLHMDKTKLDPLEWCLLSLACVTI